MGFEPTRAEPIGLAVQRLNHSATSSPCPQGGNMCRVQLHTNSMVLGKNMRRPGIEPGSTAWKAAMLTIIPPTPDTGGG